MAIVHVTDATFEAEVLRSELPVLVDLHADWCQPCKQLAPILAEVAEELDGKLTVAKVDVDANPMVAQSFRVQSIPMLVVIQDGQVAGHHMGLLDKAGVMALIEPVLPTPANEVKPKDLAQLLAAGRAVAVDVRDANAYGRYRIPGSVNLPAEQILDKREALLPRDGRVRVLYGRSTDEAKDLANRLGELGVQVAFLSGGFLHWEADELEVERGV